MIPFAYLTPWGTVTIDRHPDNSDPPFASLTPLRVGGAGGEVQWAAGGCLFPPRKVE